MTQTEAAIRATLEELGQNLAVLTSFQREGVVIIDLVRRILPKARIVTIYTGRLPSATLRMVLKVEQHFGLAIEPMLPADAEVRSMAALHGLDLFRDSVAKRMLCCEIRKVRPLTKEAKQFDGLFIGLRRGQSEGRKEIPLVDRSQNPARISPLVDWSAEDVSAYSRMHGLPEHELYAAGYTSIGCDPCTRAVYSGESERAGRWSWETEADKECGLHFSADGRAVRTVDILLGEVLARANAH